MDCQINIEELLSIENAIEAIDRVINEGLLNFFYQEEKYKFPTKNTYLMVYK